MIVISILMTCLCGIALASSKSQMFQQIVNKTSTATPLEKLAFTNPGVCQVSDTKLTIIFNETLYYLFNFTVFFVPEICSSIDKKKVLNKI